MYALYTKDRVEEKDHFQMYAECSLFGSKGGFIPWLLAKHIPPDQGGPYKWHIDVPSELDKTTEYARMTLIIDLKPKQREKNVALYEVLDVWGYSAKGWTPVMLRLSGLFVDAEPAGIDRNDFFIEDEKRQDAIYEYLYVQGSVACGALTDKWILPPASSTNGALLFPDAMKYFLQCMRQLNPELFV